MKRIVTIIALLVLFTTSLQAQIVGATNNSPQQKPPKTTRVENSLYKPTGHYIRFEGGWPKFYSIGYGYQINPYLMVGAGIGSGILLYDFHEYSSYYGWDMHGIGDNTDGIPIYSEIVLSTPKYKWSFITDLKVGYNYSVEKDKTRINGEVTETWHYKRLFMSLTIGVSYKNLSISFGASPNSNEVFAAYLSYNFPISLLAKVFAK
jgi:hypothetical protein